MSQDLLGPMNIKIVTDENENHVFTSNQEKKLLFENSILFFDDQRPQSGARRPLEGAFFVDKVNDKTLSLTSKIDDQGTTVSGEGKAVTFAVKYSQVQALRPAILPHAVGDAVCQGWSANSANGSRWKVVGPTVVAQAAGGGDKFKRQALSAVLMEWKEGESEGDEGEWQVAEENWDLTGDAVQNSLVHGDAVVSWGCPKKVAVEAISPSQQELLPCGVKEVFTDQAMTKWGGGWLKHVIMLLGVDDISFDHLIKFLCGLLIKKHVEDGDVMDPEEVRANVSLIFADLLPEEDSEEAWKEMEENWGEAVAEWSTTFPIPKIARFSPADRETAQEVGNAMEENASNVGSA